MKKILMVSVGLILSTCVAVPALAKENPVNRFAQQIQSDKVFTTNGKVEQLTFVKPTIFFAWWCPHCHEALKQLQKDHLISQLYFVSVWSDKFGSYKVNNLSIAQRDTEKALKTLGIHIPSDHLFFTLPNNPINTQLRTVPTMIKKENHGYFMSQGTPALASSWIKWLGGSV